MSLVPIDGIIPPGGYHFVDRSGGTENRITGSGYANVAENLLSFRLKNGYPMGNPLQEVYDYVCSNWRHVCTDTNPEPAPIDPRASLASRVSDWVGRFVTLTGPDAGAEETVAKQRADVCRGCPKNQNYRGGCTPCVASIEQQSFIYRRNRDVPGGDTLGACTVLNEHTRTSVWSTKLKPIPAGADVPDTCWRK